MLLSCILVFFGLRLWEQDLHAPFYYDLDALLYLPLVKTMLEHGSHWRNERLGWPGVQELDDFPVIDHLHFTIIKLIGRFTSDLLLVYNIYNLLTYPLTVLTAMWVLRWLKLSLPVAALGGLLYAFLPFHQERYQYHYFLAAYWVVPLSLIPTLALCKGNFPFFPTRPDGSRRLKLLSLLTLGYIVLGTVTASAGAYYAFFACATYAFAGLYAWVVFRTWRGAVSAVLVVAPVVAVGIAYHYPTYVHQKKYGSTTVTQRGPEEAEIYGLKLAHLLLPTNDHNLRLFARIRTQYSSVTRPAESESAGSLGVLGGIGLVSLMVMAVLPHRKRWPEGPLAALTVFLLFLAVIGGLGAVFNLLVMAQIRAYNRISIVVGFLCLFAVLWWLDRYLLTRTGRMRKFRYPILAVIFIAAFLDQTPYSWFKPRVVTAIDKHAERFRADKRFFAKIEQAAPGAKVFCLPYSAFPEGRPIHKMPAYEHARGYIMTDTLCWSFGAMKGRETDAWLRDVSFVKTDELLPRIVARGFDAILIDGRGFPPIPGHNAATLINRINDLYALLVKQRGARLPEVVHEDGNQFFLDLRPYRDAYKQVDGPSFERIATQEREWVAPLWLNGFSTADQVDAIAPVHWGSYNSTLVFVNPTDRTRKFTLEFTIGVDVYGPFILTMTGENLTLTGSDVTRAGPNEHSFTLEKPLVPEHDKSLHGDRTTYQIEIPPGRSAIQFRCEAPSYFIPGDYRNLCFFIKDFTMKEH